MQASEGLLAKAVSSLDTLTHPLQPSLVPIHPEPISPANFAPFGQIIQAYPDPSTRAEGMIVQGNPAAKVEKYCRLADVVNTYPAGEGAYTGIGVYRATKKVGLERGKVFDVRLMERHMYTSQAFIPMAKGEVSVFELSLPPSQRGGADGFSGRTRVRRHCPQAASSWSSSRRMERVSDYHCFVLYCDDLTAQTTARTPQPSSHSS